MSRRRTPEERLHVVWRPFQASFVSLLSQESAVGNYGMLNGFVMNVTDLVTKLVGGAPSADDLASRARVARCAARPAC